jgi:hypothetical protein
MSHSNHKRKHNNKDIIENGQTVYKREHFSIYKVGNGYIAHNTSIKDFEQGHTHIKSLYLAKLVIRCAIKRKILEKRKLSESVFIYLLISIIRICDKDAEEYKQHIQDLIDTRKQKGRKDIYMNPQSRGRN